ncbi:Protein N-acetyltransferase, RimJ/RimL family [Litoreibacter ascidiaceicola]|uniref:Protein N-acetyltransferase, RimJ/RimL family n=1 Tax=Litoreibacter ascidiaceicola TaxID=1486859 RepID=A0A1M4XUV0_9RHOB|nr:GNAT family N-acetyltransferase [Litoreibacter ascidiaceicola]SHE97126.1 Protein N-acetyltransferase, RimJ/RimL family [Litoreibacter ascidiaceicola]
MTVTFSTPTLETERLILRAPKAADVDAYAAHYASERSQYIGGPKDAEDAWEIFSFEAGHWIMRGFGHYIITRKGNDQAIGLTGHFAPPWFPEKEIGWALFDKKDEGQGLALEAAKACLDHAWNVLKWDTIVSYIDPRNTASIKLAKRLGAAHDPEAKFPNPLKTWGLVYRHPKPEAA